MKYIFSITCVIIFLLDQELCGANKDGVITEANNDKIPEFNTDRNRSFAECADVCRELRRQRRPEGDTYRRINGNNGKEQVEKGHINDEGQRHGYGQNRGGHGNRGRNRRRCENQYYGGWFQGYEMAKAQCINDAIRGGYITRAYATNSETFPRNADISTETKSGAAFAAGYGKASGQTVIAGVAHSPERGTVVGYANGVHFPEGNTGQKEGPVNERQDGNRRNSWSEKENVNVNRRVYLRTDDVNYNNGNIANVGRDNVAGHTGPADVYGVGIVSEGNPTTGKHFTDARNRETPHGRDDSLVRRHDTRTVQGESVGTRSSGIPNSGTEIAKAGNRGSPAYRREDYVVRGHGTVISQVEDTGIAPAKNPHSGGKFTPTRNIEASAYGKDDSIAGGHRPSNVDAENVNVASQSGITNRDDVNYRSSNGQEVNSDRYVPNVRESGRRFVVGEKSGFESGGRSVLGEAAVRTASRNAYASGISVSDGSVTGHGIAYVDPDSIVSNSKNQGSASDRVPALRSAPGTVYNRGTSVKENSVSAHDNPVTRDQHANPTSDSARVDSAARSFRAGAYGSGYASGEKVVFGSGVLREPKNREGGSYGTGILVKNGAFNGTAMGGVN